MHELLVPILIFCFIIAIVWSLQSSETSIEDLYLYDDEGELITNDRKSDHLDRELKSLGFMGYALLLLKNLILSLKYIIPLLVIYAILKILI